MDVRSLRTTSGKEKLFFCRFFFGRSRDKKPVFVFGAKSTEGCWVLVTLTIDDVVQVRPSSVSRPCEDQGDHKIQIKASGI